MSRNRVILIVAVVAVLAVLYGIGNNHSTSGQHTIPKEFGSHGRKFTLYVPDKGPTRRPLVLLLHGWNQSPKQIAFVSQTNDIAKKEGFDVAYPAGENEEWNAGGCCGGAKADDVDFLVDVVDATAKLTKIDKTRVYIWGFSNGGMMAWREVCAKPKVFAAAGVVSGNLFGICHSVVKVRHIHGTDDNAVPYYGGKSSIPGLVVPSSATENQRVPRGSVVSTTLLNGWKHAWPTGKPKGEGGINASLALWQFDDKYREP